MDKADLINKLSSVNAPIDSYSIDSDSNESLCFIYENPFWKIFYSERGVRNDERFYATEQDACDAFFSRLEIMLDIKKI